MLEYAFVVEKKDKGGEKRLVHRLVAQAFIGGDRSRRHINHKDGNKRNNRVENLEYATPQENVLHAWRTGLSVPLSGEQHGASKLRDRDIVVIRQAAARGITGVILASVFNVTEAAISSITRNDTWKHIVPERQEEYV